MSKPVTDLSWSDLYRDAIAYAREQGTVKPSGLQRRFGISYMKAAKIIERMQEEKIIGLSWENSAGGYVVEKDGAHP